MTIHHGSQRLNKAVRILATGVGRIQERLADAVIYGLAGLNSSTDLPAGDVRDEYDFVMAVVTSRTGEDGAVKATVSSMTDEDAVEVVRRILALAYEMEQRTK